jgi:hypothetical protein
MIHNYPKKEDFTIGKMPVLFSHQRNPLLEVKPFAKQDRAVNPEPECCFSSRRSFSIGLRSSIASKRMGMPSVGEFRTNGGND